MKPTEAQCKRLTDFIGECNHKWGGGLVEQPHGCEITAVTCGRCRCDKFQKPRTFLTPDDIFRVKEALEENGLFSSFLQYAFDNIEETDYRHSGTNPDEVMYNAVFISVLYGKDEDRDYRFCRLVAEYLKEGENGK
jgi:hypothetical protein